MTQRFHHYAAAGVGSHRHDAPPSANHFTKPDKQASAMIDELGLQRVAGNLYECPSTRDFWKVSDKGGITRLTSDEVDNGEHIEAAPKEAAEDFLHDVLAGLDF